MKRRKKEKKAIIKRTSNTQTFFTTLHLWIAKSSKLNLSTCYRLQSLWSRSYLGFAWKRPCAHQWDDGPWGTLLACFIIQIQWSKIIWNHESKTQMFKMATDFQHLRDGSWIRDITHLIFIGTGQSQLLSKSNEVPECLVPLKVKS